MPLDFLATAPHYVDHLLPIWAALPAAERRHFYLGPKARRDGIPGARRIEMVGKDSRIPILTVAHGDFKVARANRRPDIALGQHGAGQSYCVAPATRVLTADLRWVTAGTVAVGDELVAFDEDRPSARGRRWRRATVVEARRLVRPCYELEMEDGTVLVSSAEHRWLKARSETYDWLETSRLRSSGLRASRLVKLLEPWGEDRSWGAGYLAAAFDGEGYLTRSDRDESRGQRMMLGYTQRPNAMSAEVERQLDLRGFPWRRFDHPNGVSTWNLTGGRSQLLRFLGQIRPRRLLGGFHPDDGGRIRSIGNVRIKRIRFLGDREVIGLTTSTGTFVAEGFASHNSTDHPSYPGGRDQDQVGLFLVPNQHAADRTLAAYPDANVAIVGCPKLDKLPKRKRGDGKPVVAVSFHFSSSVAPETRTTWPLYRAHVAELARTIKVLGHAHPRLLDQLGPYYRSNRIEVARSLDEVFERADLYVCDNSSSLFEFASTGRPVLVLNAPWFRPKARHGLRFWAAAGVGIQVDRPRDLAAAVARALEDPPEVRAAREAALDIVYQPRRGGARLAAKALLEWAA